MSLDRCVTVLAAGALTTVQDRGRPGWAHLGVPRAGALDRPAAELANRLVGNPAEAAVLECTGGRLALRVSTAMAVAVTGAPVRVTVDGRPRPWCEPLALHAGQVLRLGVPTRGVRCYVALAGGVDVPPVLGSRSTDTLAGVGPPVLSDGARLPVGPDVGVPHAVDVAVSAGARHRSAHATPAGGAGGRCLLRYRPGPRDDWFPPAALATLDRAAYLVSPASNRVALRLQGPALGRDRPGEPPGELPSEGLVLGAIQVPTDGQPLVFLNDHPTTGGYPVVGVVAEEDLAACAQLRPGDEVGFTRR